MRKFSFKLPTQVKLERLETTEEVNTWGQLKNVIRRSNSASKFPVKDIVFVEKNTKAMFGSIDDAVLPAGNLLFYVTPTKTKSGSITPNNILTFEEEEVRDFLTGLNHIELIDFADKVNNIYNTDIYTDTSADNIKENIMDWFEDAEKPLTLVKGSVKENLLSAIDLIQLAINKLGNGEHVDEDTLAEINAEAERIRKAIQEG
ncbi:MAG TPA: hypothetical protein PLG47_05505 [Candidatus Dojkabacteria bacterium]|nr:hypothetical protein [Candidatus Dojkabacteria bacterium]